MAGKREPLREKKTFRVLSELIRRVTGGRVSKDGAEFAYYLLFSLFPLLIVLNTVLGRLNIHINELLSDYHHILPVEAVGIITDYLEYLNSITPTAASALFVSSIVLCVYSLSKVIDSLTHSVRKVYRVGPKKSYSGALGALIASLGMIVSFMLLLLLVLLGSDLLGAIDRYVQVPQALFRVWDLLRFFIAPVYLLFAALLFYHLTAGRQYPVITSLPGAIFSLVTCWASSYAFSAYVANMGRYSLVYGSLGAIIILMLWFRLIGEVLIIGGVLNHVLLTQHDPPIEPRAPKRRFRGFVTRIKALIRGKA